MRWRNPGARRDVVSLHHLWMYDARNDDRVRPSHAAMDGIIFRHDDPIWATHYSPNGWNCRCRVRVLTSE